MAEVGRKRRGGNEGRGEREKGQGEKERARGEEEDERGEGKGCIMAVGGMDAPDSCRLTCSPSRW